MLAFRFLLPLAAACAAATAIAPPALAQRGPVIRGGQPLLSGTDGRWLANACASREAADRSFCYGYILGLTDQLSLSGQICRPANVTGDLLVSTVRSHLTASPNDLQRHASLLVRRVLAARYPCQR
jgi:hypothetical protein